MNDGVLLTVREAAARLALREGTVRFWLADRRLPKVKLGRAVRIPREAIEELIARSTTPKRDRKEAG
jgi:excisionase family DNA binding protein